jgi:hypothetical protein
MGLALPEFWYLKPHESWEIGWGSLAFSVRCNIGNGGGPNFRENRALACDRAGKGVALLFLDGAQFLEQALLLTGTHLDIHALQLAPCAQVDSA